MRYLSLSATFETIDLRVTFFQVFLANAAIDPLSPKSKTTRFKMLTHQFDHLGFGEAKLKKDGFKGRSIFPGHFDDTVFVYKGEHKGVNKR